MDVDPAEVEQLMKLDNVTESELLRRAMFIVSL